MSVTQSEWDLISAVLLSGPSDGRNIYNHARQHDLWQTLYLATKASPFAERWRVAYGQRPATPDRSETILNLALRHLKNSALSSQSIEFALKLIANCCADDNENRRVVLNADGVGVVLRFLNAGFNPNVVVPTLYNICADFDEPAMPVDDTEQMTDDSSVQVTRAEELLSTKDHKTPILRGLLDLLQSQVVLGSSPEIKEYLAELVEMSARPAAIAPSTLKIQAEYWSIADVITTLTMANGGRHLAEASASCRVHVCHAMLSCVNLDQIKRYIAGSGLVYDIAMLAAPHRDDPDYFGEDDEEQRENVEMLNSCQTAVLKLVYEISQMTEFTQPAQYGVARKALDLLPLEPESIRKQSSFMQAVGLVLLYGFVDGDIRALLLASEGNVVERLRTIIEHGRDKVVLYPAIALAAKLAVTWNLRGKLYASGLLQATQRLLLASDLGFEIPATTITLIELIIKGHPEHTSLLYQRGATSSIISDVQTLFRKDHEAINVEIGRLFMELCSTLAQREPSKAPYSQVSPLEAFLQQIDVGFGASVLIFVAIKGSSTDPVGGSRVWFTMGLLSTTSTGREILTDILKDKDMAEKVKNINSGEAGPAKDNVRYMLHNLHHSGNDRSEHALTQAIGSLRLGI